MRFGVIGAGLAVLAVAGVGCSDKADSGQPSAQAAAASSGARANASLLQASVANSVSSTTVQFDATATVNNTPLGNLTLQANGAADFARQAASATGTAMGMTFTVVTDGSGAYVQSPILGSDWYRVGDSSFGLDQIFSQPFADPATAFALIQSSSDNVQNVGPETIRGVATTHYKATVNLAKAAAAAGATNQEIADKLGKLGTSTEPIDVWVDGQGRIAQMTLAYTPGAAAPTPAQGASASFTINFTNYGQPVTITIPPASSVKDLSQSNLGNLLPHKNP
jgi:hypothetical protein